MGREPRDLLPNCARSLAATEASSFETCPTPESDKNIDRSVGDSVPTARTGVLTCPKSIS